jgi:transposase
MVSDLGNTVESTHTIGRTSARSARVEVLPRAERRRSWTAEQKLAIVGESFGPDLTPTEVARRHRISTGQIYTWRQQFLSYEGAAVSRAAPRFTTVELTPACTPSHPSPPEPPPCSSPAAPPQPEGLIEIVLPGGVSVRVDSNVDALALRRVLGALEGR